MRLYFFEVIPSRLFQRAITCIAMNVQISETKGKEIYVIGKNVRLKRIFW